ncbi:MAG: hypothetical protein KGL39_15650 [Patescibacteria group bacterium]|nr:hypothetical protein [Patescibacteria group bacterium]
MALAGFVFAALLVLLLLLLSGCASAPAPLATVAPRPALPQMPTASVSEVPELFTNVIALSWIPCPQATGTRINVGTVSGSYSETTNLWMTDHVTFTYVSTNPPERWFYTAQSTRGTNISAMSGEVHWPLYPPRLVALLLNGHGPVSLSTDLRTWVNAYTDPTNVLLTNLGGNAFYRGQGVSLSPVMSAPY